MQVAARRFFAVPRSTHHLLTTCFFLIELGGGIFGNWKPAKSRIIAPSVVDQESVCRDRIAFKRDDMDVVAVGARPGAAGGVHGDAMKVLCQPGEAAM